MEQVRLQGVYGIGTDTCAYTESFYRFRLRGNQRVYRNSKGCSSDRLEAVKTESHIFNIYEVEKCIFMQETAYLCKCYRVYAKNAVFGIHLTIFLQYESYISSFLQIRKNAKNSQKIAKK